MVDTFDCARAQIYHNTERLTPAQIKKKFGCTHIINGYLFNGKFQPVAWLANASESVSRADMVRALYQIWGDKNG